MYKVCFFRKSGTAILIGVFLLLLSPANSTGERNANDLIVDVTDDIYVDLENYGHVGIGLPTNATISGWPDDGQWLGIDLGGNSSMMVNRSNGSLHISNNAYYGGSPKSWRYKLNGYAANYYQNSGGHFWRISPEGSANNTLPWTNYQPISAGEIRDVTNPHPEIQFSYGVQKEMSNEGVGDAQLTLSRTNINLIHGGLYFWNNRKLPGQGFPDHVFKEEYDLMPLDDLSAFVKRHHHLPDVPGEEEANKSGIEMGSFQLKLLEQIEKLTLYTIQQQELIDELKSELESMKQKE
ncbi:MAG: hypothetical protein KC964_02950 [Candidatus Omnitrophica bacterium]|nr:hypothetical protein [Candidatus Omnitrophota bacterium]